jgi:hypothetical protein
MQKEDQIMGMLEQIIGTLDDHGKKLDRHEAMLISQGKKLDRHEMKLDKLENKVDSQEAKLDKHGSILEDHSQMLRALLSGQETLIAGFDGMKVSNAKEFAAIKEKQDHTTTKLELLREDTWVNRQDIHRIKNTIGIN